MRSPPYGHRCPIFEPGRKEGSCYRHLASQKSLTVSRKNRKRERNAEVRKRFLEHGCDFLIRALTARINYMTEDRADLMFTSICVSHFMSEPTPEAWRALMRIGRCLIGACRIVQTFKWRAVSSQVEGYGDSDWAGDTVSRRPQDMVSSTEDDRTL